MKDYGVGNKKLLVARSNKIQLVLEDEKQNKDTNRKVDDK